jgi:hypothetical protein
MTHVEEEQVTTTREEVEPQQPQQPRVNNINLNVNPGGEPGTTVSIDDPPAETTKTTTETTHSEVHESD